MSDRVNITRPRTNCQGMGDKMAVSFARALRSLPNVEHLNLCDNRLRDEGIEAIVESLEHMQVHVHVHVVHTVDTH